MARIWWGSSILSRTQEVPGPRLAPAVGAMRGCAQISSTAGPHWPMLPVLPMDPSPLSSQSWAPPGLPPASDWARGLLTWSLLGDPDGWASSLLGLCCLSAPLPPLLCAGLSPPFSAPPLHPSRHLPPYTSCVNGPVLISISQRTQTNTRSLLLEGVGHPVLQNSSRAAESCHIFTQSAFTPLPWNILFSNSHSSLCLPLGFVAFGFIFCSSVFCLISLTKWYWC